MSCVVHDTSCIGQRCPELRRITMMASQVTSLLICKHPAACHASTVTLAHLFMNTLQLQVFSYMREVREPSHCAKHV